MSQPEPSQSTTSPRRFNWRHLFQFRLRTLLILTTIIAVALGWWSHKARQQREAVAALEKFRGAVSKFWQGEAWVDYDYNLPCTGWMQDPPQWPQWLQDSVGVDYIGSVATMNLTEADVNDADLEHLKTLTTLRFINLNHTQVTDTGLARLQKALPNCKIEHTHRPPP